MKLPRISQDRLKEVLIYEPETGHFRRRIKVNPNTVVGSIAGTIGTRGYWQTRIDGRIYTNHRLAWFWVHGYWPANDLDHINGVRTDNRICNLREATRSQNIANAKERSTNTTGYQGAFRRGKKWSSYITVCGERKYLGLFEKPEQAHAAYASAARKFFGEFARV